MAPRLAGRWACALRVSAFLVLLGGAPAVRALDLSAVWDYSRPELSEQRFLLALESAQGDDAFVLRTQIARTHGLRRDFERAKSLLRQLQASLTAVGPEAQVRYHLEWGRAHASAAHRQDLLSPEARDEARRAFGAALEIGQRFQLDELTIDAIHMFAFVDTAPSQQLHWARRALAIVEASDQAGAKKWEASIRNNLGYALHRSGLYPEALEQFQQALTLRERSGSAAAAAVAKWMVAWTLRALGRADEALSLQLALEQEHDARGRADPHVFEELAILYRAKGDTQRAAHYTERLAAARAK